MIYLKKIIMNIRAKLKKMFISPFFWLIAYISTILFFAIVYKNNSNSFYQPNIEYDIQYKKLETKAKEDFKAVLLNSLTKTSEPIYIDTNDGRYGVEKDSIKVDMFNSEDVSFNISVNILDTKKYDYDGKYAFMKYCLQYKIYLTGTRFFMEDNTVLQTCKTEQISSVYDAIEHKEKEDLIDISEAFSGNDWSFPIKITAKLDKDLWSILYANDGFGTYVNNNFEECFILV